MRHLALRLCVLVPLIGCGGRDSLEPALAEAIDALTSALAKSDFDALWAMTDQKTRDGLLDAFREADHARTLVPDVWSPTDRVAAAEGLGATLAAAIGPDDDKRGPRLLAATLSPSALVFDEGALEGLAPRDVTIEPGPPRRAFVVTTAGERLTLIEEDGAWKSLLVRDLVLETESIKTLVTHAKKTLALADEQKKAWQESLDPKTPQGSYNLARAAQDRKPPDIDMLFALLDDDARKSLVDILEAARAAQRQIQQRTPKALRRDAYRSAGLLQLVETTTDRELFRRWATSPEFKALLPATDAPKASDGDPASGSIAILTESDVRIPMRLDADGFWRLSGLRETLTTGLGAKSPEPDGSKNR